MRPRQQCPAAELLPVIGSDRFGQPACLGQLVEDARELLPAYCSLRNNGYSLVGRVINDCQILDDAPFCCPIEHKIHGPYLVGGQGPFEGMAFGDRDLLPLALSNLQTRFGIEPIYTLVVNDLAGLTQL